MTRGVAPYLLDFPNQGLVEDRQPDGGRPKHPVWSVCRDVDGIPWGQVNGPVVYLAHLRATPRFLNSEGPV